MHKKIIIAGDGGQGIQKMAEIICAATLKKNYYVSLVPNFGLEQRGGASIAFVQISDQKISYPKFVRPDIILILSAQANERVRQFKVKDIKIFDIKDYADILKQNNIAQASYNVFFLGLLAKILSADEITDTDTVNKILEEKFSQKSNWTENQKAFDFGFACLPLGDLPKGD